MNMKPYVVTRTATALPVLGRAQAGTTSTVNITGNVQPVDGKDLKVLPEARWGQDIRKIFTATELYIVGKNVAGTIYDADTFLIGGEPFEVFKVGDWLGNHYECFAARQSKP